MAVDGTLYGLISADLMAVELGWVEELRRRAEVELGLSKANLMVACTHTHSATGGLFCFPDSFGDVLQGVFGESCGGFDDVMYEWLLRQALAGLRQALANLRPAAISSSVESLHGIASNRRHVEREVDPSCFVLQVSDRHMDCIATVIHFTCHPTVLGDQDARISGDFPGIACALLEQALGHGSVALFLNGCLGDISTRFTRTVPAYAESVRFGRMVAGAALKAIGTARQLKSINLNSTLYSLQLPAKSQKWVAHAEERAAGAQRELAAQQGTAPHGMVRQLTTDLQGAEIAVRIAEPLSRLKSVPFQIQHLRISEEVDLMAMPGELFSSLGRMVESAVPEGTTVRLVGPANGYLGYVPDSSAYDEGGYEVDGSIVDKGAGEAIAAFAAKLVT